MPVPHTCMCTGVGWHCVLREMRNHGKSNVSCSTGVSSTVVGELKTGTEESPAISPSLQGQACRARCYPFLWTDVFLECLLDSGTCLHVAARLSFPMWASSLKPFIATVGRRAAENMVSQGEEDGPGDKLVGILSKFWAIAEPQLLWGSESQVFLGGMSCSLERSPLKSPATSPEPGSVSAAAGGVGRCRQLHQQWLKLVDMRKYK